MCIRDRLLLERVRYAVASLAFHEYLPYAQVQINEEGVQVISSENAKAAFRWQVEKLEESSLNSGYRFLEMLLSFLEENREDYPDWIHADREVFLIHSASNFNEEVFINSSRLIFLRMMPSMKRVQRRIRARISSALFDLLRQLAAADGLEGKDIQLTEYLKAAIANLAYADSIRNLPVQFEGGKMSIYSNDFPSDFKPGVQPQLETLALLARKHAEAGEKALRKAIKYIETNIDDFPGYQDSGHYTAPDQITSRDIEDSGFFFLWKTKFTLI